MNKKELEKNILDLKYKFQMEKIRVSLLVITVGIISFVGTFIWYLDRLAFGIGISTIITLVSLIYYKNAKNQLKNIVGDIRKLA